MVTASCSAAAGRGVSLSVQMTELTCSVIVRGRVAGSMVLPCKVLRFVLLLEHLKSHSRPLSGVESGNLRVFAPNKKFLSSLQAFWLCRKLKMVSIAEKVLTQVIFILSGYIFSYFKRKQKKHTWLIPFQVHPKQTIKSRYTLRKTNSTYNCKSCRSLEVFWGFFCFVFSFYP